MARDPLEQRRFQSVTPTDALDPARFGQLAETVQDAFVEALRTYFSRADVRARAHGAEMPTIRKYNMPAPISGSTPTPTAAQLIQDYADLRENFPHVCVLGLGGQNDPRTVGRPTYGPTQLPPRLVSAPEPFAFGGPVAEVWTIEPDLDPAGGTAALDVLGEFVAIDYLAGEPARPVLDRLVSALVNGPAHEYVRVERAGLTVTITHRETGQAFEVDAAAGLTATRTTAAVDEEVTVLRYRTTPEADGRAVVESEVVFDPSRYPSNETPGATSAARAATIFNEQALHARARVVVRDGTNRVEIRPWPYTPNEIEVLASSSPAASTELGWGASATLVSFGVPDSGGLQRVTASSPLFAASQVGAYLTVAGDSENAGRLQIASYVSPTAADVVNDDGSAETGLVGVTGFVGARDDWTNPARPIQNTYVVAWSPTVMLVVLAEDPAERQELADVVWTWATFFMEERHFTLLGRGVLDDDYPDEQYQISFEPAQASRANPSDTPRPEGDRKGKIHEAQISIPVRCEWTIARPVTVPASAEGPPEGTSWTIDRIEPNEDLVGAS